MYKLTIIGGCILLAGCGLHDGNGGEIRHEKPDEFYSVTGGWDWKRVPLIKPYEVKKVDPEIETNSWSIEFIRSLGPYNVKLIDVRNSTIYLVSGKVDEADDSTLLDLRNVPTAWFVIDTRKKTEKGFASESGFTNFIKANGYPPPNWHEIDSLSQALSNGAKLPWMPEQ